MSRKFKIPSVLDLPQSLCFTIDNTCVGRSSYSFHFMKMRKLRAGCESDCPRSLRSGKTDGIGTNLRRFDR